MIDNNLGYLFVNYDEYNNSKQRGDNKKIVKDAKNLIKNIKEERQVYNLDISIKLR